MLKFSNNFLTFVIVFVVTLFICNDSMTISEDTFQHNIALDENGKFKMYWNVSENQETVTIGLIVEATGWIAIGLSSNGQMPLSDIMFAWVSDDGSVYLEDRHVGTSRSIPQLDVSQDLTLIYGSEVNGETHIIFSRLSFPSDTADACFQYGTDRILFAWNPDNKDPDPNNFDSTVEWHGSGEAKGSKSVNVLEGTVVIVELEDDIETFEITMDNYALPSNDTTYYCKLFKLPEMNETHHIVKFEPLIQAGNEGVVHHVVLYACSASLIDETNIGFEETCTRFANMPMTEAGCVRGQFTYSWAIGGEAFYMPEHVGMDLSGPTSMATLQYVVLEIHYDNPLERSDVVDSSGVRITYTPSLREFSASQLTIMMYPDATHVIPSGSVAVPSHSYCNRDCTNRGIGSEGARAIGVLLHMHTVGVEIVLRHIRNGTELPPIAENLSYDFNFQTMIRLEDEPLILPGDELVVECTYDTSGRDSTVFGGESTYHEMCAAYILMYGVDYTLGTCITSLYPLMQTFGETAISNGYMTNMDTWDYDFSVEGAVDFYDDLWYDPSWATHNEYCTDIGNNPILDNFFSFRPHPLSTLKEEYDIDEGCKNYVAYDGSTGAPQNTIMPSTTAFGINSKVLNKCNMFTYVMLYLMFLFVF